MNQTLEQTARQHLRKSLGNPKAEFRDGQLEAIEYLVSDKSRLLIVQRTGWGKSMVYFLATRLLRDRGAGPSLLISPLLALMRNQILAARKIGIRAATINSSNVKSWSKVQAGLLADKIDILLVSPERLANDEFRENMLLPVTDRIGLFIIDEAHCISDWGHDFRPDYLRITRIIQSLPPNVPVLATTATANQRVVDDVIAQLGERLSVIRGPLSRSSLYLQNIKLPTQIERMAWLAEILSKIKGSGIIYVLTIRDAQRLASWLQHKGIDVHPYWGGLDNEHRQELEDKLLNNKIKALVATTALGMGFDKPDLKFVIHYQRPGSVVHYYQQVGRAGRAVKSALGILLSGDEDSEITDYFIKTAFPPKAHVQQVLSALESADDGLSIPMLTRELNLQYDQIEKVLKRLSVESPSPVRKQSTKWYRNPVQYEIDHEKITRLTQLRKSEQARMLEYIDWDGCLMKFLADELDDPTATECGKCAVCRGKPIAPIEIPEALVAEAAEFLQRSELEIEPRKQWPNGGLPIYDWKGKIRDELKPEPGRALCMWGDPGWGSMVRRGKFDGHFKDELVRGAAKMIRHRWRPDPFPVWLTCVPSLNHPSLVPDFARRLARELGIPFHPCIIKKRVTPPQKEMLNSYRQANNLDGAFIINPSPLFEKPVLLIDDIVDSRWTLTIMAALLRSHGSGKVYPMALSLATPSYFSPKECLQTT